MTNVKYDNLLFEIGEDLRNDPNVDLKCLKFFSRKKLAKDCLKDINDSVEWLGELDKNGDISIDNFTFLKEIRQELEKKSCLDKIVKFEAERSEMLAVQLQRRLATSMGAAAGEDNRIVASPGVALEPRGGGINFVVENYSNTECCGTLLRSDERLI